MISQLDLFKAEVVAFPADRRRVEVIRAAKFLNVVRGGIYAERGWKRICRDMARSLRDAGVEEIEVRRQIMAFQDAVQAELNAMAVRREIQA
ncbi:DUF6074 family protein [Aquamicrobium soli]|uniref:DUF6074 family protein n=1 Tax=Aquamicrobium soli TaxID=1811518 RepID=A0ABV7KC35_9HYPH